MATIEVKKVYKLIRNNGTHSFFTEDKLEYFQKYCEERNKDKNGFYKYRIEEIPFMDFLIEVANHCVQHAEHLDFTWWDKEN